MIHARIPTDIPHPDIIRKGRRVPGSRTTAARAGVHLRRTS
jgi:hypothetical protein